MIRDEKARAQVLSALAEQFPEVLPEALSAAQAIGYDRNQAEAISILAEQFPEILPEALSAAQAIEDVQERAQVL